MTNRMGGDMRLLADLGIQVDPKTNADRIRSMSEKELAVLLYSVFGVDDQKIAFCKNKAECNAMLDADEDIPEAMCLQCLMDWLKQPYSGGV